MGKNGRIQAMFWKKSQQNEVTDYTMETEDKDGVKDGSRLGE